MTFIQLYYLHFNFKWSDPLILTLDFHFPNLLTGRSPPGLRPWTLPRSTGGWSSTRRPTTCSTLWRSLDTGAGLLNYFTKTNVSQAKRMDEQNYILSVPTIEMSRFAYTKILQIRKKAWELMEGREWRDGGSGGGWRLTALKYFLSQKRDLVSDISVT